VRQGDDLRRRRRNLSVRPGGLRVLSRLREGLERRELCVILPVAPLREVPDVDDGEPPPLQPRRDALPE
jgi:hypothetical protein